MRVRPWCIVRWPVVHGMGGECAGPFRWGWIDARWDSRGGTGRWALGRNAGQRGEIGRHCGTKAAVHAYTQVLVV